MRRLITLILILNLTICGPIFAEALKNPNGADDILDITSDRLDVAEGKAVFTGNVVATKGDMVIKAGSLTLYFKGPDKQVSRLTAQTKVHMTWQDKEAWCDRADYMMDEEQMTLTGNVTIIRGEEKLSGNKVFVDTAKDRQIVEGQGGRVKIRVNTEQESSIFQWKK